MSYGNIYWYFSSARLDFALLVDRQMQQGKCRIGIRGDICVFVFAIIGGGWQFGLGVIILSIHLIIAYFREFSDWGAGNVFSSRKSSGSRSSSRSASGSCDMDGDYLSYHQEQAMKDYWDNVDSTHSWNDRPDIYDHEGNIDYDKVDQANEDMNAEINGRV